MEKNDTKIPNSGHKEVAVLLKKEAIKYHKGGNITCLSGLLQETKYSNTSSERKWRTLSFSLEAPSAELPCE